MKHEKEWYTCDRCGEEIKDDIHAWKSPVKHILRRYKTSEYIQIISSTKHGYVNGTEPDLSELPEVVSVEIICGYDKKNETIHLCGKCRKSFEQFMKNGVIL